MEMEPADTGAREVPADHIKGLDIAGGDDIGLPCRSRGRVHDANAEVVLPVARLITVALSVACGEQREIRRTAVEREIWRVTEAQLPDPVSAVAVQVEHAENGEVIEIDVLRSARPGTGKEVDRIDATHEAKRMSDLMERNTNEIDGAGGYPVARIEIPGEVAAEGDTCIGRTSVDRLPVRIGRDSERLQIGCVDVEESIVGRAIIVEHPRARQIVGKKRKT